MPSQAPCLLVLSQIIASPCAGEAPVDLDPQSELRARTRLASLRQQVAAQQQEIRELEALLDEKTQIDVRLQLIEIDAAAGRQAGLPIPGMNPGAGVTPIPTIVNSEGQSILILMEEEARVLIDALTEQGHAKSIATPAVQTEDNREATVLSGGEFPWLMPQNNSASVEWKEFGTRATVHPRILENGHVRVRFQASVSERDFSKSVKVQGMVIPGITTKRIASSVDMEIGKTLILCGMTWRPVPDAGDPQPPVLKKLPYVSRLYRQTSAVEGSSEAALVVLVTPSLQSNAKD